MKCSSTVRLKRTNTRADDNSQPCQFHISASLPKGTTEGTGTWTFHTVSKIQTCRVDQIGRKRNINSNILMATSDALCSFVPGDRKSHGNTKYLQKIALSSGLHLKTSQAFNIVKARSQHTIEYHLASYWYLHPVVSCLKTEDPCGTYILESASTSSATLQFRRFYVASSHTKRNFRGSLRMRIEDGTHVTSQYFHGIFLVCVGIDANRQVKLLAFARVGTETKANWLWFESLLQNDLPNTDFVHADYSKGIESKEFAHLIEAGGIRYGCCFRHMLKNCSTKASKEGEEKIKEGKGFSSTNFILCEE